MKLKRGDVLVWEANGEIWLHVFTKRVANRGWFEMEFGGYECHIPSLEALHPVLLGNLEET